MSERAAQIEARITELKELAATVAPPVRSDALDLYARHLAEYEYVQQTSVPQALALQPAMKRLLKELRRQLGKALVTAGVLSLIADDAFASLNAEVPMPIQAFSRMVTRTLAQDIAMIESSLDPQVWDTKLRLKVETFLLWKHLVPKYPHKTRDMHQLALRWGLTTTEDKENFRRTFIRDTHL